MGARPKNVAAFAALALLVLAGQPAGSSAAPGSAIDQYREHIPEAGGELPSREVGDAREGALSPGALRALEPFGEVGAAAAELAQRTAPERSGAARALGGSGEPGEDEGEDPPVTVVAGQIGGAGGGMGRGLPVILALGLLAALAFVLAPRRDARRGEET